MMSFKKKTEQKIKLVTDLTESYQVESLTDTSNTRNELYVIGYGTHIAKSDTNNPELFKDTYNKPKGAKESQKNSQTSSNGHLSSKKLAIDIDKSIPRGSSTELVLTTFKPFISKSKTEKLVVTHSHPLYKDLTTKLSTNSYNCDIVKV